MKPVVALDIDGTLGVYHDHFIEFAEAWAGLVIPRGYDGSVPFNKWCMMSKARYRQCKLAYRRGGLKRSMPMYPHARGLTVALRKNGALVVICTTRPFLALDNVDPDTVHCLRRNGIQFDNIIHGERKYRELVKRYGQDQIAFVMDDLPEMLEQASSLGLPAVMRRNGHNSHVEWSPAVDDLFEASALGWQLLDKWKREHR